MPILDVFRTDVGIWIKKRGETFVRRVIFEITIFLTIQESPSRPSDL